MLRLALSLVQERQRAEHFVEEAFARVLTKSMGETGLEPRLAAMVHKVAGSRERGQTLLSLPPAGVPVSGDLHQRILDAIEDRQYTSQPVRSRLIVLGVALLLVAAAGLVQLQRARSEALAAAAPTVADLVPAPGSSEVGVDGEFGVQFARRPVGTPTLSHFPADGSQHQSSWDGTTLLVDYTGLRFGVRYELVVDANYQSKLRETGHFQKRWTFVAQGPPRVATLDPPDGTRMVARYGVLTVDFSRRPTSEPVVSLQPPVSLAPGPWSGSSFTVHYSDLRPLAQYTADVTVASTDPAGRIHRTWTFTVEPGPPPASVPVAWYSTVSPWQSGSGDPNRYVALDWSGNMVGTLYGNNLVRQNFDGSWLATMDGATVEDRTGRTVASGSQGSAMWSDVGGHYCNIGFGPFDRRQWLEVGTVGAKPRVVSQLGVPQAGFTLLACSNLADRAVLGDQGQTGYVDLRVIQLSTGRLLYHRQPVEGFTAVSSRDGGYLAETPVSFSGPSATVIRRLSDNVVVAHVGDKRVVWFSWDGSLVLVAPSWSSQGPGEVQLLDWHKGTIVWRHPVDPVNGGPPQVFALAQPNGSALIVGMTSPASGGPSGNNLADGLFLVHTDGRAEQIVTGSVFLAAYPG